MASYRAHHATINEHAAQRVLTITICIFWRSSHFSREGDYSPNTLTVYAPYHFTSPILSLQGVPTLSSSSSQQGILYALSSHHLNPILPLFPLNPLPSAPPSPPKTPGFRPIASATSTAFSVHFLASPSRSATQRSTPRLKSIVTSQ
jgi:hypothetical protein